MTTPILPTKTDLNGNPTAGTFKVAIGALYDYISGIIASMIPFTPVGDISATNVQSAIQELDTEKLQIPANITQGDIIYRGASGFERLAAGTSGQVLKTNGESSNPAWIDAPGNPTGTIIYLLSKTTPTGYLKPNGAAISRTAYANLLNNSFCSIQQTGVVTSGSVAITGLSTTVDMAIGMAIEGVGIPSGATIASITSLTAITISVSATATGASVSLIVFPYGNGDKSTTFNLPDLRGEHLRSWDDTRNADITGFTLTTTSGSAVISSIADTGFMFVGMPLSGAGIPTGATVASITSATAITMSANATVTSTKLVTFTGRRFGSWQSDDLKSHIHSTTHQYSSSLSGGGGYCLQNTPPNGTMSVNANTTGGAETRGRNYAIPVYIKY